jgi:hypothetical protein
MKNFVAVYLAAFLSMQVNSAFSQVDALVVPTQNKDMGTIPPFDNAETLAQSLFTALQNNDTVTARNLFFPEAEFIALKDIKDPKGYYKQLLDELDRDVSKQHTQLKTYKDLKYVSVKRGGCKWKAIGSEYNKIAYWSCYRNRIIATADNKQIQLDLKTLINWGDKWYITHLGREIK